MSKTGSGLLGNTICVFILLLLICISAQADALRTQTVSLHKGWNAVFLQVDPTNASPSDCFRGTPISIVALYSGSKAVQYVQNPTTNNLNPSHGWSVWYADARPDAFLTSLFSISGNNAYLIYSQNDFVWSVSGNVILRQIKWKPNSFNLVGFGLDDASPPTFDQFFDASAEHHPYKIYRLANDQWVSVGNAQTTQMRNGEACWIFCNGSSDYQGPLYVKPELGQSINLYGLTQAGTLLANKTKNPMVVRVENSSSAVPLAYMLNIVTSSNVVATSFDLPTVYSMQTFEAGERRGFWLRLRPEQMADATRSTLLKITSDIGTQCWLPVNAFRSGLNSAN